jgi:hypothetical protein
MSSTRQDGASMPLGVSGRSIAARSNRWSLTARIRPPYHLLFVLHGEVGFERPQRDDLPMTSESNARRCHGSSAPSEWFSRSNDHRRLPTGLRIARSSRKPFGHPNEYMKARSLASRLPIAFRRERGRFRSLCSSVFWRDSRLVESFRPLREHYKTAEGSQSGKETGTRSPGEHVRTARRVFPPERE